MEGDLVRQINEALTKSGERERLKELVKERLRQAGWFDQLVAEVDREARNRNVETVSPQELTTAVYPRAIESIPAQVKRELQEEIRSFLDSHIRVA